MRGGVFEDLSGKKIRLSNARTFHDFFVKSVALLATCSSLECELDRVQKNVRLNFMDVCVRFCGVW